MNISAKTDSPKFPKRLRNAMLAAAFATLTINCAHADDLTITGWQYGGPPDVNISLAGQSIAGNAAGAAVDVYAGAYNISASSGPLAGQSFIAYCADVVKSDRVGLPATNYASGNLAAAFGATKANDFLKLASAHYTSINNATSSAAFQIAAWEILFESGNSYDLSNGSFKAVGGSAATSGALSSAQNWLDTLSSVTPSAQYTATLFHVDSGNQDIVALLPVPEPETYAMLLSGLGMLGFIARRRKIA